MEAELERVKQTLAQVCRDSQEIERELELQIQESNARCAELAAELAALRADRQQQAQPTPNAPTKAAAETDAAAAAGSAVESAAATRELRTQLQVLETNNDELENEVRQLKSDLHSVRTENLELLERLALREADTLAAAEQQQQIERLRQELVDANEELEYLAKQRPRPLARPLGVKRPSHVESLIQPSAELRSKQWKST